LTLRHSWTTACQTCPIKSRCTPSLNSRITHWEHEAVLETALRRLDENPRAMRQRREVVEHPFGSIKMRVGAMHFLLFQTVPTKAVLPMALDHPDPGINQVGQTLSGT
jgi:hypothetical protein